MADGGNVENRFFGHNSTDCPISAKFCTRKQSDMPTKATWEKTDYFKNPKWRTAAILKIAKSPYLSEKSSNFDNIWYTKADIQPDDSHVNKNWNL